MTDEQLVRAKKKLAEAQAVQSAAIAAPRIAPITAWPVQAPGAYSVTMGEGFTGFFPGQHPKYEMQSEDLGTRDFGGVLAEGRRSITTIPAAAIGNERPIEITYERWYSKELELVVYSKHSDPRFGDQTYTLTNIVRSEPDPSLFTVPTGFKLVTEPGFVYKLSTKPAMTTTPRPAVAPKPPTAVTVKSTIP